MATIRWTLLAAIASFVRAEIDLYDIDGSSLSEALVYSGYHTDQPAFLFERSLLEERQYCAAGYGTCPGGTRCGCPKTALCCGTICKALETTCCGDYVCPQGWGCCGGSGSSGTCYPYGGDCCSNGRYCNPGAVCVRLNNDAVSIRCSIIGETSTVAADYSSISTPPFTPSTGIDTYSFSSYQPTATALSWYTQTFTINYYYYFVTSYRFVSTYSTSVDYSYTSSSTALSCEASDNFDAYITMSSQANVIQDSVSGEAESTSSSLSRSLAAAVRTASAADSGSSTARVGASASARASTTLGSGGGGIVGAGRVLVPGVSLVLMLGMGFTSFVATMMLVL